MDTFVESYEDDLGDDANSATMRCGYFDLKSPIKGLGQHTYGEANKKVNFNCYGGSHKTGGKNEVYPAKFATIKKWRGDTIKVHLDRARYYAANGQKGWKDRDDYDKIPPNIFRPDESFFGDCSGLWYAIGGVCHQMANSIFVSEGKTTKSGLVWPPSFYATWGLYGLRGNHTWNWNLPKRLKVLINSYPKVIPEDVDLMCEDVREMLTFDTDNAEWRDNMLREAKDVLGDDFAKPGQEGAFVEEVRKAREEKNSLVLRVLRSEVTPTTLAERLNDLGTEFASRSANYLNDELAADFRSIEGLSVDPNAMHPEEAFRILAQKLNI